MVEKNNPTGKLFYPAVCVALLGHHLTEIIQIISIQNKQSKLFLDKEVTSRIFLSFAEVQVLELQESLKTAGNLQLWWVIIFG